ncbi:peptidoglycan bridge formation glycyltransferase FemA/FemB family protein [Actinomycetaceae bacterium MB13-C1-2]|nr:peptidoglycan bridge formation glycyltransferase FemA/FemB family protein [Actinomycetaceae bacterium MB13-C1-2]
MEFQTLTDEQYQGFIDQYDRVYLTQLLEYGDVRRDEGVEIARVGLLNGGEIVAAATVVLEPWKKVFRRACVYYGPMLDYRETGLLREFITGLKAWAHKERSVIALRVNPYVLRRFYKDITPGPETEIAKSVDSVMNDLGGRRVLGDFYTDPTIQPNHMYTKDLGNMSFEQILSSVKNNVRTDIRNATANGVEVEFLGPEDFGVLRAVLDHTEDRTGMPPITDANLARCRDMMEKMGTARYLFPAAILDTNRALKSIAQETETIELQMKLLEPDHQHTPTRKQQKQLKELKFRHDALIRRREKTLKVSRERGEHVVLTASLFVETPTDLIYHHSGGYEDLASFRGIYAIHEAMLKHAALRGLRWYNMHAVPDLADENGPGLGVLEFKRHFQGNVEELVGTYEFPIRPFLARVLGAVGG